MYVKAHIDRHQSHKQNFSEIYNPFSSPLIHVPANLAAQCIQLRQYSCILLIEGNVHNDSFSEHCLLISSNLINATIRVGVIGPKARIIKVISAKHR